MKRIIPILILTFCYFLSFSQKGNIRISRLSIAFNGDSTRLMENYEIDFSKKKVFQITSIASYLHVRGGKPRKKIRLGKNEWKEIKRLGIRIDFEKLAAYSQVNTQKNTYFAERTLNNGEILRLRLTEENISEELKGLFEIIRGSK